MLSYKKFFESKQEVDSICRKYRIQNYTINPDKSIDVRDINASKNILKEGLKIFGQGLSNTKVERK